MGACWLVDESTWILPNPGGFIRPEEIILGFGFNFTGETAEEELGLYPKLAFEENAVFAAPDDSLITSSVERNFTLPVSTGFSLLQCLALCHPESP